MVSHKREHQTGRGLRASRAPHLNLLIDEQGAGPAVIGYHLRANRECVAETQRPRHIWESRGWCKYLAGELRKHRDHPQHKAPEDWLASEDPAGVWSWVNPDYMADSAELVPAVSASLAALLDPGLGPDG